MSNTAVARAYIAAPFRAFQPALTEQLVQTGWAELVHRGLSDSAAYGVAASLGQQPTVAPGPELALSTGAVVRVELPDFQQLGAFYETHGLAEFLLPPVGLAAALPRLAAAFAVLMQVPAAGNCVSQLVRSLLVLQPPDAETDLGYSHPAVPFSIFVSVCADDSPVASLRVAESILHEAMHLQLTLLEGVLPLVQPNSEATFYSPWRDELRPVRGVLHGLYVFRVIHDFYQQLRGQLTVGEQPDFVAGRLQTIQQEIVNLADFSRAAGLTEAGQQLTSKLLNVVAA